jgi:hypothetical protein
VDLPLTGAYSTLEAANNNHSSIMHTPATAYPHFVIFIKASVAFNLW